MDLVGKTALLLPGGLYTVGSGCDERLPGVGAGVDAGDHEERLGQKAGSGRNWHE